MRIGEVIGKVTLSKCHPALTGATWLVVTPLSQAGLKGDAKGRTEPIVLFDERGAGEGALVAISESMEAAAPFYPELKPIDAYNAAILDELEIN